ncbi:glycoside hydrolase family 5 protein, partial [Athelia psychrophila]
MEDDTRDAQAAPGLVSGEHASGAAGIADRLYHYPHQYTPTPTRTHAPPLGPTRHLHKQGLDHTAKLSDITKRGEFHKNRPNFIGQGSRDLSPMMSPHTQTQAHGLPLNPRSAPMLVCNRVSPMRFTSILPFVLEAYFIAAQNVHKRDDGFVTTQGGDFYLNGSVFNFIGTNAYWLPTLTEDKDIENTFSSMSAAGIKVIRTRALNDVAEIPTSRTWFQPMANGTTRINDSADGLARPDKVVEVAQAHGIYLIFSLTNNWNLLPGDDTTQIPAACRSNSITGNTLSRNYISNDFGEMDAYVREFGMKEDHDEFYTNSSIVEIFNSYIINVVSKYLDRSAILAWEIGNDPGCISSLPTGNCTPQTVTQWHSTVAKHVKSIDPNHLVSSGSGGFFCTGCPKLFPAETTCNGALETTGLRIRGRWAATPTRRGTNCSTGSAYNGSQGVDSKNIFNIPKIEYSSFQIFPDQDAYGSADDPSIPAYNQMVDMDVDWIDQHVAAAATYFKLSVSTGLGLVTTSQAPSYVPFASAEVGGIIGRASDGQRDGAYQPWFRTIISSKVNGMVQYQWGQSGLTVTPASPVALGTNLLGSGDTDDSPNDGHSGSGAGQ